MITLHLQSACLPRLAELPRAAAGSPGDGPIRHVRFFASCPPDPTHVCTSRFQATDGCIVANLLASTEWAQVDEVRHVDILLNASQLGEAAKSLAERRYRFRDLVLAIDPVRGEVRMSVDEHAWLVRIHAEQYPQVDRVLEGFIGASWIPSLSTFSPAYLTLAKKLIGPKRDVLFHAAVPQGSALHTLRPRARTVKQPATTDDAPPASIDVAELRTAIGQLGVWADHELLIALAPVGRTDDRPSIDVGRWLRPAALTVAAEAVPVLAAV